MRSRLEARVAAALDLSGMSWEYEALCFASERGQYLPDFRIVCPDSLAGADGEWWEVKPPLTERRRFEVMAQMEIIWESLVSAALVLCEKHPVEDDWALLWLGFPGELWVESLPLRLGALA
jgi:hypothetical protein